MDYLRVLLVLSHAIEKGTPAASGHSMLRNEYGIPTSRSLFSIVQRLRWYKSLNNKILRMLQNDGQRFFLEIVFFGSSQVKLTAALGAFQRDKQGVQIAQKRLFSANAKPVSAVTVGRANSLQ